jgi:hypothetical protein
MPLSFRPQGVTLSLCLGVLVVQQSSPALTERHSFIFIWRIPPLFDLNSGEIHLPLYPLKGIHAAGA